MHCPQNKTGPADWRGRPISGLEMPDRQNFGSGGRAMGRRQRPGGGSRVIQEATDCHAHFVCRRETLRIQIPHGIFDGYELQPILIGNDNADGFTTDFDNLLLHNNSCRTEGAANSILRLFEEGSAVTFGGVPYALSL
jgi:hypothetical protein